MTTLSRRFVGSTPGYAVGVAALAAPDRTPAISVFLSTPQTPSVAVRLSLEDAALLRGHLDEAIDAVASVARPPSQAPRHRIDRYVPGCPWALGKRTAP